MTGDKPLSALGLEPRTYGLKVRCRDDANDNPGHELQPSEIPGCTPGCTSQTETAPIDSDLAKVIGAWPTLPEHLKAAVMALVATVGPMAVLARQTAADAKR